MHIRPSHHNEVTLPAQPRSVGAARDILAHDLDELGTPGSRRFDALVVASELVANAIEHGSHPGDSVDFAYSIDGTRLVIAVRDPARVRTAPVALTADEQRAHGRGLQIVDRLATWSEHIVEGRREVSAEIDLEAGPSHPDTPPPS